MEEDIKLSYMSDMLKNFFVTKSFSKLLEIHSPNTSASSEFREKIKNNP
jgi:hypothetical protein